MADTEKILAESRLCNVAKFRNIMILVGALLFVCACVLRVVTGMRNREKRIAEWDARISGSYETIRRDYEEYHAKWEQFYQTHYAGNESWEKVYPAARDYVKYMLDTHRVSVHYPDILLDGIIDGKSQDEIIIGYREEQEQGSSWFYRTLGIDAEAGDITETLLIGGGAWLLCALVGVLVWLAYRNNSITVTYKRVTGRTAWNKMVELPRNQISAISLGGIKGVAVATSSGLVRFSLIANRDEIFRAVSELLKSTQDAPVSAPAPAAPQSGGADELAKYKALLDSGAISQEEYDAKKRQILGL